MKPVDNYTNGDEGLGAGSEGSEDEFDAEAEELSLVDAGAPARALSALNALRKSRQHYDVVLLAGGAEVAAHRAVLAAASPYLLEALPALAPAPAPAPYRVHEVDGEALRALVEYAYSGRLVVRGAPAARQLYRAAWRLRVEAARAHLADRLLRRLQPADCLAVRELPGLKPDQLRQLDRYIATNFEEVCSSGALGTLPQVRVEVLRDSGAATGAEDALTVADAVLAWLRAQPGADRDFTELCSRAHLVYVDARGALRDCGELPHAHGDAPELQLYRRDAAARKRAAPAPAPAPRALPGLQLGQRALGGDCAVLAARRTAGGATRALLELRGGLLAVRAGWAAGASAAQPGQALAGGARPARLGSGRCALGAVALGSSLLACGGYDRARVLRSAERYDPALNAWSAAPDMRRERARFPVAALRDTVFAFGGSDGHSELDSVDSYSEAGGWRARARLPLALSHAAAACDGAALYVAGGWAAGAYLRRAWRYDPEAEAWSEMPALGTARAQCAGAHWEGALWVLGGCDAWHCLASAERLALAPGEAGWRAGPALPSARRSMGAAVWRGRLVAAGGSDGAASLRRTDWLEPGWADSDSDSDGGCWRAGPPLRRARAGAGLAVLQETLYAVGGFDGKEFLACAECLSRPDGEWTALCAASRPDAGLPLAEDERDQLREKPPEDSGAAASQ